MKTRVHVGVAERFVPVEGGRAKAAVWYPSEPADAGPPYLNLFSAHAALEALPLTGRRQLVLLVSGTGGTRYTHSFLAEHLAAAGYCVVAPETPPGNQAVDRWANLRLCSAFVQATLAGIVSAELPVELDDRGTVYIGHSSGATIGLLLAGARLAASPSWALPSPTETRLAALVLLDPALSSAFASDTLAAIRTPAAVFYSGLQDADLRGRPGHYVEHLDNVRMARCFPDVGHYVYCNEAPPVLAKIAPQLCRDTPRRRAEVHADLQASILEFLSSPRFSGTDEFTFRAVAHSTR
jgi:pimeloyl-ACP methyl ester carboxylesterase